MTENKTANTSAGKQSLEFMTKMMLMKNSKSKSYIDSMYYYRKNAQNPSR